MRALITVGLFIISLILGCAISTNHENNVLGVNDVIVENTKYKDGVRIKLLHLSNSCVDLLGRAHKTADNHKLEVITEKATAAVKQPFLEDRCDFKFSFCIKPEEGSEQKYLRYHYNGEDNQEYHARGSLLK